MRYVVCGVSLPFGGHIISLGECRIYGCVRGLEADIFPDFSLFQYFNDRKRLADK